MRKKSDFTSYHKVSHPGKNTRWKFISVISTYEGMQQPQWSLRVRRHQTGSGRHNGKRFHCQRIRRSEWMWSWRTRPSTHGSPRWFFRFVPLARTQSPTEYHRDRSKWKPLFFAPSWPMTRSSECANHVVPLDKPIRFHKEAIGKCKKYANSGLLTRWIEDWIRTEL